MSPSFPNQRSTELNRRTVLAGSAALAGSIALATTGASAAPAAAATAGATSADVIIVGHGLAGLVAAAELADAGKKVILVDQESEANFGAQAHWSLGGLFFIDSPEQRLCQIRDSLDIAWADWFDTAGFDRNPDDPAGEDYWGKKWAEAYLHFAAGEKRSWLASMGMHWIPIVGWAERGGMRADGPGNSVPRFHMTLGTGPGVVEPFERRVRDAARRGLITFRFRRQVDDIVVTDGRVTGVRGSVLEASALPRGIESSRTVVGEFELSASAVIVASGGIGGNHDLVRENWPSRLGTAPTTMTTGVPAHVDGRMLEISSRAGGRLVNNDRMWHYTEGIANHSPIWPGHGIRLLAAPTSMWFDATGQRFPDPGVPSHDTLGTLELIQNTGYDYSWFVLNKRIASKEFVLSGSEQNPELTDKDLVRYLANRALDAVPKPVQAFLDRGPDFVTAHSVGELAAGMNRLTGTNLINAAQLENQIVARDRQIRNPFTKDTQVMSENNSRSYAGDNLVRTTDPHAILDPAAGPLVAIKLSILTRKSLGGLQTDLGGRVMSDAGTPVPGLFAAGEVAGFGGGGYHGYRALEGTFLGGCLFSGRETGRTVAREV